MDTTVCPAACICLKMSGSRHVAGDTVPDWAGLLAILAKGVTAGEVTGPGADCHPPGCSTGRLAVKVKVTGFPSPGTLPRIGSAARLTSGDTLYTLFTCNSYMLVLVSID